MRPVDLGAFRLLSPLAAGGMGEVWRAVHRARGVPVAVKLVGGEAARTARYRALFREEVRAVARLDHPGIVRVLDYGEVDAAAGDASDGRLSPGDPFLVMELVPRGSLDRSPAAGSWPTVRRLLLDLLEALAHAHARGVVHRDVKPANVLLSPRGDGAAPSELRPVLTDFGIAAALERVPAEGTSRGAGTPAYMAPEQIRGAWAELGPWTDLYALGCLAWELLTGAVPWPGAPQEQIRAHLSAPLPSFRPRLPVPEGADEWLLKLLAKSPERRFRRAADAAWALTRLGDVAPAAPFTASLDASAGTWVFESAESAAPRGHTLVLPPAPTEDRAAERIEGRVAPTGADGSAPPLPPTWRAPQASRRIELEGAGLGLFGVRRIPVVGREAERDVMWQALSACVLTRRPRVVVVHGAAGRGKTSLARAVAERAHEVGAANVLEAVHAPTASPGDGLGPMLAKARSAARLDEDATRLERVAAAADALRDLARDRLALVVIDDAQWGAEALHLVRHALDAPEPVAALFLLTVREEALAERTTEASALRALEARPGVTRIDLPPLGIGDQLALVERHLGLASGLAYDVAGRTQGDPLLAVQLVGDWVRRGLLVASDDGFVLADGAPAALPDDLRAVWRSRVDDLAASLGEGARHAFEIAAALGQDVDAAEWEAAVARAGVTAPPDLPGALVERRLASDRPGGFLLVHGLLRESLAADAKAAGRWAAWNAACAAALRVRADIPPVRVGWHLYEAGSREEALPLVVKGARVARDRGDEATCRDLWYAAERLVAGLGLPLHDPLRLEVELGLAVSVDPFRGPDAAIERLRAIVADPRCEESPDPYAQALYLLGDFLHRRGDPGALALLQRSIEVAERGGSWIGAVMGGRRSALLLADLGRFDEALAMARRTLEVARDIPSNPSGMPRTLSDIATIYERCGRLEEAQRLFREAIDTTAPNMRAYRLPPLVGLAEVARRRGDLDAAEAGAREAVAILEAMGLPALGPALLNLALIALARGRDAEAEEALGRSRRILRRTGDVFHLAAADLLGLGPAGRAQRWDEFARLLESALAGFSKVPHLDRDVATGAETAALLAAAVGRSADARALWTLAARQYRGLKDPRAEAAEAALSAVGTA